MGLRGLLLGACPATLGWHQWEEGLDYKSEFFFVFVFYGCNIFILFAFGCAGSLLLHRLFLAVASGLLTAVASCGARAWLPQEWLLKSPLLSPRTPSRRPAASWEQWGAPWWWKMAVSSVLNRGRRPADQFPREHLCGPCHARAKALAPLPPDHTPYLPSVPAGSTSSFQGWSFYKESVSATPICHLKQMMSFKVINNILLCSFSWVCLK